jgi:NADH-quinone oxidoreductase subunit C
VSLPDGQEQDSQPSTAASAETPDAGTTPQPDPAAAEAPQAPKAVEQKAASEAPPSQTGTPPGEQAAADAAPVAAEKPAAETAAPKPAAERPARPAREAEPKEAPRVPPPPGSINEVLAEAAPGLSINAYMVPDMRGESVAVEVSRDDLLAVMTAAREDPRLDLKYLRCLSGVDWQDEGLEVAYHLWSFTKEHKLTVKTRVPVDDARVPSMAGLYPAADWHERETRDMFGIEFEGHPNLVPLLLPEDMTDHFPLRKDNPLQEIEEWQGENLREGAGEDDE